MRLVRYGGAMSLDGYIAGPNGEYDWIVMDPDIDFAGNAVAVRHLPDRPQDVRGHGEHGQRRPSRRRASRTSCFSRTLKPADYPHITVESDAERVVSELRAKPGKDIAIFGGGELFRSLLAAGLVDRVEVALIPVLLGGGIPLLPSPAGGRCSSCDKQRVYEKTGTIGLEYDIVRT